MGTAEDYRRFAQECVEMANATASPRTRATLLHMAQVWLRLAQEHETERQDEEP